MIRPGKPYADDIPANSVQGAAGISGSVGKMSGYSKEFEDHQRLLIKRGYKIKADGFSGTITTNAIKDFQRKYGLKITGLFDAPTLKKLR